MYDMILAKDFRQRHAFIQLPEWIIEMNFGARRQKSHIIRLCFDIVNYSTVDIVNYSQTILYLAYAVQYIIMRIFDVVNC